MVAETKTDCLQKLHCSFVLNSNPNNISCTKTMAASKEANLNTDEAINFVFADEDSENNSDEEEESEESSDNDQDSSDENNNDHEIPVSVASARVQVRTRGGQRRGI